MKKALLKSLKVKKVKCMGQKNTLQSIIQEQLVLIKKLEIKVIINKIMDNLKSKVIFHLCIIKNNHNIMQIKFNIRRICHLIKTVFFKYKIVAPYLPLIMLYRIMLNKMYN
jgi:hypothetical protein